MGQALALGSAGLNRRSVEDAARTAVAASVSLVVARLARMPEAYWAAVTTIVVLQSTLGAALSVSMLRFIGTALGAVAGGVLAARFGPNTWVFAGGVFLLGLLTAATHCDKSAFRFAGITLAIVMLVARTESPWGIAFHRFVEVSIGIAIGLLFTAVWPEHAAAAATAPTDKPRSD